jgi:nicotinate-nucleotide adenylyltransferase
MGKKGEGTPDDALHHSGTPTEGTLTCAKHTSGTPQRIGLFGGTFDPVHHGHLIIAQAVLEHTRLDRMVFIPSARPPHKGQDVMFGAAARSLFLTLAVHGHQRFEVSDIELHRRGPSYTIDTLRELKSLLPPGAELFFLVGADNLNEIETWKDPRSILEECTILVANRACPEDHSIPDWIADRVERIPTPVIDISSSDIRRRIREGKSIRYLVPEAVAEEIARTFRPGDPLLTG